MGKTLANRLDEACESHGLEWLILPFDSSPECWREGPYWGVLVSAQYPRGHGRGARPHRDSEQTDTPAQRRPGPQVLYITIEPSGREETKRLLLARIDGDPPV